MIYYLQNNFFLIEFTTNSSFYILFIHNNKKITWMMIGLFKDGIVEF